MSLEIGLQPEAQTLTPQGETEVVNFCKSVWTKGEQELAPSRKRKKRIVKAYECQHEDLILKRTGSKGYLPWIYRAIEAMHSRLMNSLIPNDEDIFALMGETPDDQPGCDMMAEYMKYVLKQMGFHNTFSDVIKQVLFGEVVLKVYWKVEEKVHTVAQVEPLVDESGEPVIDEFGKPQHHIKAVPQTIKLYNNVYAEVIDSSNFILYPIWGDPDRATYAHQVWRFRDELMAVQDAGIYRNVDKIPESKDTPTFSAAVNGDNPVNEGLSVKEFYIHRIKVDGVVYRNMVATIVDDTYLIRFEPNEYDYGLKPFIYCALIKNYKVEGGIQNTGHGICDRGLEIQKMGNFIINQVFDESKIKLFGLYKYKEDGVFNPATFVSRAGGMIRVGDLNNIMPINPNIGALSFGIEELQYLEDQFEAVTGVPKFLQGVQEDVSGRNTATANRLAADGADTRTRTLANTINENLLKPFLKIGYALLRKEAIKDPEVLYDIARRTEQTRTQIQGQPVDISRQDPVALLQSMPAIPPLPSVDVNIVGYENVLDKADKAGQFERFMNGLSGAARFYPSIFDFLDPEMAIKCYAQYLSIDKEVLRSPAEVEQQREMDAQQQQAQAAEQAQQQGAQGQQEQQQQQQQAALDHMRQLQLIQAKQSGSKA